MTSTGRLLSTAILLLAGPLAAAQPAPPAPDPAKEARLAWFREAKLAWMPFNIAPLIPLPFTIAGRKAAEWTLALKTEVVLVADGREPPGASAGITRVSPDRVGTDRPFLLYYGDGPAYALLTANKRGKGGLELFHTSERVLVEHLVFQLQRDLGIPLSA